MILTKIVLWLCDNMEREIGTAFGEQAFSDVVIKYSGQELKAHKIILCTRSKYFESAFGEGGRFKVSGSRERLCRQVANN